MPFLDCWGFDNNLFSMASTCWYGIKFFLIDFYLLLRRVKSLSIEGCSLLTTEAQEFLVLSLKELQVKK